MRRNWGRRFGGKIARMSVAIVTHPALAAHDTGDHPERAARWERTDARLAALGLPRVKPGPIAPDALARVHPPSHGERIKAFCEAGGGRLDEDTVACPASYEVALLSAGAAVAAVDRVATGGSRAAVALCRPPGHHALADQTMGFCFFNNAALAARHAQAAYGLQRVAILDWDLHHGNGTEAIFYDDPSVLYLSTHQHPNWPGSGAPTDVGTGLGKGFTVNVQLPIGTGDAGYMRTLTEVFAPVVTAFKPQLIIVSAGYDAHWRDPLGRMGLTVEGFAAMTREVMAWADRLCGGKLVVLMEGGYDLDALADSMLATVQALAGQPARDALGSSPYREPAAEVERAIARTRQALAPYWRFS
jgi:acetoin utilization deacetylase AcuC-like enzyme